MANGISNGIRIDGTEVEQRPQDVGAGDPGLPQRSQPLEIARSVDHDAVVRGQASPCAHLDHIDRVVVRPWDAPERGRRAV